MSDTVHAAKRRLVELLKRARGDIAVRGEVRRLEQRLEGLLARVVPSAQEISPPPASRGPLAQAPQEIQQLFVNPSPWMAAGAIKRASELLSEDMTALEWGGGASTPYWCERVDVLHTVEASTGWAAILLDYMGHRLDLLDKWRLHFIPANWPSVDSARRRTGRALPIPPVKRRLEADYAILLPDRVDAIFIDGAVRQRTMERLDQYLTTGQVRMIVVDNSNQPYVRQSIEIVDLGAFTREDHWDDAVRGAAAGESVCTTVWYRR
ncbi:MAG: hypothetical protein H0V93_08780 [Euzebyales bacterium]|jgi:hypothetical protein|nr:hypothetical protein [Euzebyales bacterium]